MITQLTGRFFDIRDSGLVRVARRRVTIPGLRGSTPLSHTVAANVYDLVWPQNVAGTGGGGPGLYDVTVDYTYTSA